MIPKIEFAYDNAVWTITLRQGDKIGRGRHWFITLAFIKAAQAYFMDDYNEV